MAITRIFWAFKQISKLLLKNGNYNVTIKDKKDTIYEGQLIINKLTWIDLPRYVIAMCKNFQPTYQQLKSYNVSMRII